MKLTVNSCEIARDIDIFIHWDRYLWKVHMVKYFMIFFFVFIKCNVHDKCFFVSFWKEVEELTTN